MNNYYRGHLAEWAALWFMRLKGYHLVCRNYVSGRGTGAGEVDLILARRRTLVFVEVKLRPSMEQSAYAILPAQQKRIRRAAEAFLGSHPAYREYDIRFDSLLVTFPFRICHLPDSF